MPTTYLWTPPAPPSLAVEGMTARFPVHRIFCVGRNYPAHAVEMGRPVDRRTARPFYFIKSSAHLVESGAAIPYPPGTGDFHYETELVVALGASGFRIAPTDVHTLIFGHACGLDLTRRDLQSVAKEEGKPWDLGKDFEQAAVCGPLRPLHGDTLPDRGSISLEVNGERRQSSDLSRMIWTVRELIADLSTFYHLQPGDLIYTGTPEGVGPLHPGDRLEGEIEGVGRVRLSIDSPE
ncbi:fumarylacetoacetate hydrolase family protein [Zoogloea sp.]|uniref:fumarylacetoacetate hydrolase family protein n=1 Tax=Zoogloea sp. TaxID=49181 RepID=UPI00262F8C9A|nr:fumarylacetoacetate hydrolase family protein [Zoogloea sp.]MDD3354873.1 fumarylacetoacetate hydrolase family protein [Zoogloea sp.]